MTHEQTNETNERKSKAPQFEESEIIYRQTVLGSKDRPRGSSISLADLRTPPSGFSVVHVHVRVCVHVHAVLP